MILLAFLQQALQSRLILSTMQQVYNHTSKEEAYLIFIQFEKEKKTQTRILLKTLFAIYLCRYVVAKRHGTKSMMGRSDGAEHPEKTRNVCF